MQHITDCLDSIAPSMQPPCHETQSQFDEGAATTVKLPLPTVPDYSQMPAKQLKEELSKLGMKITLSVKQARETLQGTWNYVHNRVLPEFLNKYLKG